MARKGIDIHAHITPEGFLQLPPPSGRRLVRVCNRRICSSAACTTTTPKPLWLALIQRICRGMRLRNWAKKLMRMMLSTERLLLQLRQGRRYDSRCMSLAKHKRFVCGRRMANPGLPHPLRIGLANLLDAGAVADVGRTNVDAYKSVTAD